MVKKARFVGINRVALKVGDMPEGAAVADVIEV
jgi:hypothetical protein